MGFDASKAAEPLDYDFTTLDPCPPLLKDAKGRIPEPSAEIVNQFSSAFYSMMELMNDLVMGELKRVSAEGGKESGTEEPEAVPTLLERIEAWRTRVDTDAEERRQMEEATVELLLIVCESVLSKDQLHAVPSRTRSAFLSWLYGELINPKGELTGTRYFPEVLTAD